MSTRVYYHIDFSKASQADVDRFNTQLETHVFAASDLAHLRPSLHTRPDGSEAVLRVHWPDQQDKDDHTVTAAQLTNAKAMRTKVESAAYVTILASAEAAAAIVAGWAA